MSLFRFTRTSQPQQPVGVDWSNPITRGLTVANYGNSRINLVDGKSEIENTSLASGASAAGVSGQALVNSTARYWKTPVVGSNGSTIFGVGKAQSVANSTLYGSYCQDGTNAGYINVIEASNYGVLSLPTYAGRSTPRPSDGTNFNHATVATSTSADAWLNGKKYGTGLGGSYGNLSVAGYVEYTSITAHPRPTNGLLFLAWGRALSDLEIKSLSDNPWQIFQPTNRAIYPETDASPDITLALTGQSAGAVEQGSVAPVITIPLTGVATAVAQGAVTVAGSPDITLPLTGLATVAGQGSLLASATVPLTGQSVVAARGTLAPETSKDLTGQAVALAQGAVLPQMSVALTGQAVVAAQGVLVAPGDVTVALTGQGVSLATGLMVGSVTPDPGNGKSGVNRMWLIEYYTKEFAKKEATQVVALEGLTATAKRKAVKKAAVEREAAVEKLVAKAESDLEVLTQGVADIGAAQKFTQALIQQVARKPEPETDFMQIATDYRQRMQRDDDELLLLAMVL